MTQAGDLGSLHRGVEGGVHERSWRSRARRGTRSTCPARVKRVLTFDEGYAPMALPVRWEGDQRPRPDQERAKVWAPGSPPVSPAAP
jgi:hypothetical protein